MKTENGSWIPASYKSGRYKKWKSGNRQEGVFGGEENEEGVVNKSRGVVGRNRGVSQCQHGLTLINAPFVIAGRKGVQKGKMGNNNGGKREGRLKNVHEIIKKREKMDFMKKRKNIKERVGVAEGQRVGLEDVAEENVNFMNNL